jgi:hypothetical protein
MDCTTGSITKALPAVASGEAGAWFTITPTNLASGNTLTITCHSGDYIDGVLNGYLRAWETGAMISVAVDSTGTKWNILGGFGRWALYDANGVIKRWLEFGPGKGPSVEVDVSTSPLTIDEVLVDDYDKVVWEIKATKGAAKRYSTIKAGHDGHAGADASNWGSTGEIDLITFGTLGASFSVDLNGSSGATQAMRLRCTTTEDDVIVSARRITL